MMGRSEQEYPEMLGRVVFEILIGPSCHWATVSVTSVRSNYGFDFIRLEVKLPFGIFEKVLDFLFQNSF